MYKYTQDLKIDFDSIANLLPSEQTYKPFIESIKQHLNKAISHFQCKYLSNFDSLLEFAISNFNEGLKNILKDKIPELNKHIQDIESNIKSIMPQIKDSSNIIENHVSPIITTLDSNLPKLTANSAKLSDFDQYNDNLHLMKVSQPNTQNGPQRGLEKSDLDNLGRIYLHLDNYKTNMKSYSSIKQNLNEMKTKLYTIKNTIKQICLKINGDSNGIGDCSKNDQSSNSNTVPDHKKTNELLMLALYLKDNYINQLDQHVNYVNTLEQIGSRISSLKSFCSSKELKDKLDTEFCNAVNKLERIDIKKRQIESLILTMKTQIKYIIPELQLIKLLLQYRDSLNILKISSWRCENVSEYLKVSPKIFETISWIRKTMDTAIKQIEELKNFITCFETYILCIISTQIKSLFQFQSTISQFQSIIDCEIRKLNSNIHCLLKFNSIVTKCVKSYLCKYIKSISNHYCSSYNSIKQNIETFKCIQECVKTMSSLVSGNDGSIREVKRVFSNMLDDNIKSTISDINRNLPMGKINSINFYYSHVDKFLDASNDISKNTEDLGTLRNELSQLSGHITNYTNRIKWFLITRLDRLTRSEPTISRINNNGNGISSKYETIKHKIKYCKSSLEYEVERLESISKNARMLQKQLEFLISMIKKHQSNVKKLEQFKTKLNELKKNKDKSMNYLCRTVRMIMYNLCDIRRISNSLDKAKDRFSIATIKQDIDNINSSIKQFNNYT